jgi:hypothetical protein
LLGFLGVIRVADGVAMPIPTMRDKIRVLDALCATTEDLWPSLGEAVRVAKNEYKSSPGDEAALVRLVDRLNAIEPTAEDLSSSLAELIDFARRAVVGKDDRPFWQRSQAMAGMI